jgi:gliding motility-associated lipoprotein GldH
MKYTLLLFLPILFFSCGKSYLYEENVKFENEEWTYQDSVSFEFAIEDTSKLYNILLALEHSPEFSTQNLYTRIATKFPDGKRPSQVVSLELADQTGFWYGECSSKSCMFEAPIQSNAYFNQTGTYTITIAQHMRRDSVPGIQALSLKLEDTGVTR